jgi:hypothetical protein
MAEDPLSLHTEVIDRISRIDDRQGPALIRDLLHAEAARSRVSPALIEMSTAVHRPDGGIDGRTYFDFDLPVIAAPAGHLVWQVKTGNEKPSASKELGKSAKHPMHRTRSAMVLTTSWCGPLTNPAPHERQS